MKRRNPNQAKSFPLQLVLIIPFVLQIFGAVGLIGYLSFRNGQKAVNDLANQLIERTSSKVNLHLNAYLSIPQKLGQINADAIKLGLLDVRDRKKVGRYFWHQMQAYDVSYIGIGLTTGEGVGAVRYDGKTLTIDDWGAKPPKNWNSYATDSQGNRTNIINILDWDNFKEPWYTEPVKAGKPIWAPIYVVNYPNHVYIATSAGRPIYDANQKLLGMVSIDVSLLKLSDFLRSLEVSRYGQIFILERDGTLIANSGKEPPYAIINKEVKRLPVTKSLDPQVQAIAKQLQQRFQTFQKITDIKKIRIDLQGESYYVHVTPWRDQYGLDWLVVTSVPEKAFMAQIYANTQTTIWLCLGALGLASVLGVCTSRWLARPIRQMNQASKAIAFGDLNQVVEDNSRIQELNALANSFNHMAAQLRKSFVELEKSNEELEHRVEERTVELKNTLNELQRTQAQVIQSEKMSSLGQLVAGVAHEINNPVNFIHGNITHAEEYTQSLLEFIQLYQQHYPHPDSEIAAAAEEIELDYLQADLPKMLASMRVGTERIRQIVLSLRNFSRMDESDVKQVNIHEGIDSTLMILQHRLKATAARPEIQVIKDYGRLPLVECYAGQLNQVLMNILTNAIDALEEANNQRSTQEIKDNCNQITIHTSVIDSGWVEIAIADNGPGIPEEIQQQIFNPFFTTKPVGKGTGMGMSISYQIITEKHGGKLKCFSSLGAGAKFVIQIPIHQKVLSRV